MTIGRAIFDRDIPPFDIASLLEALPKIADLSIICMGAAEQSDQCHRWLLRARRERPRRRAAEQRDEVAVANHSITSSAIVVPVTFPPGRLRLATSPDLTGSLPVANTIGIVLVADLAATTASVAPVNLTVKRRTSPSARSSGWWTVLGSMVATGIATRP